MVEKNWSLELMEYDIRDYPRIGNKPPQILGNRPIKILLHEDSTKHESRMPGHELLRKPKRFRVSSLYPRWLKNFLADEAATRKTLEREGLDWLGEPLKELPKPPEGEVRIFLGWLNKKVNSNRTRWYQFWIPRVVGLEPHEYGSLVKTTQTPITFKFSPSALDSLNDNTPKIDYRRTKKDGV
jgi:hypothetical protein